MKILEIDRLILGTWNDDDLQPIHLKLDWLGSTLIRHKGVMLNQSARWSLCL